eukprot:CAMPEP_0175100000 /NCGR_PEP_ID=MMETSP0086_2-20121207/6790_1 /TAXON_ID=136419 /ORGANISM="Unknown Unknown, Strain D1" /LENGTH=208 /DNA_ID=CAMNT_0016373955 /DNA_START=230 /DNA_END=856 /DNA_ORIENTATION=-
MASMLRFPEKPAYRQYSGPPRPTTAAGPRPVLKKRASSCALDVAALLGRSEVSWEPDNGLASEFEKLFAVDLRLNRRSSSTSPSSEDESKPLLRSNCRLLRGGELFSGNCAKPTERRGDLVAGENGSRNEDESARAFRAGVLGESAVEEIAVEEVVVLVVAVEEVVVLVVAVEEVVVLVVAVEETEDEEFVACVAVLMMAMADEDEGK